MHSPVAQFQTRAVKSSAEVMAVLPLLATWMEVTRAVCPSSTCRLWPVRKHHTLCMQALLRLFQAASYMPAAAAPALSATVCNPGSSMQDAS